MMKLKTFVATIMCGFSTFSIMPHTNYLAHVSNDANQIMAAGIEKTGKNLKNAIDKVGASIGKRRNITGK